MSAAGGAGGGAAYAKAVGGKLKLKGGIDLGAKLSGGKRGREEEDHAPAPSSSASSSATALGTKKALLIDVAKEAAPMAAQAASRSAGTGKITTSAATVHGQDSKFLSEVKVGDALEVQHPVSGKAEVRVVKMVLSNISIGINSPFSSDLISAASFNVLKLPKAGENAEAALARAAAKRKDEETKAFGTYAGAAADGTQVFTYRVKKEGAHGGYKVVTQKLDDVKSREELLEMRAKKKSDKYC